MEHSDPISVLKNYPTLILRLLLAVLFAAFVIAFPVVVKTPGDVVLGLLSLLVFALVAAPVYCWKDYSLFEPLTLVVLMTVVGFSLKILYVLAFSDHPYVAQDLLNGQRASVLVYGTTVVAVGLVCFMLGYWRRRQQVSFGSFPLARFQFWSETRLAVVSVIIIVVAAASFVLFARSIDVSLTSLETFSQKRFIDIRDQNSGTDYREETLQSASYYYYRIAAFAKFAFFLNLAWLIHQKKSLFSLHGLVTAWAGMQTLAVFVFMNSRASVALVVLDALIITYYLKDRIHLWKVAVALAIVSILVLIQLSMRSQREHSVWELVEKTIVGRDLMDVTKMAFIINAVPQQLEYCNGETLVGWLAAPIPISVWPKKPLWSERGVYINQRVFGARSTVSGTTLGLPAELYWNFGWAGVCVGMFLMGTVLRNLYTAFRPYCDNPTAVLIYSLVVPRLTLFTLGSDLGTGILKTALDIIPIGLLIMIIAQTEPREVQN